MSGRSKSKSRSHVENQKQRGLAQTIMDYTDLFFQTIGLLSVLLFLLGFVYMMCIGHTGVRVNDPKVWLNSAVVSGIDVVSTSESSSELTATWKLTVVVGNSNPEKFGLGVLVTEPLEVILLYKNVEVARRRKILLAAKAVAPPLSIINPSSQTPLSFQLETVNSYVTSDQAKAIVEELEMGMAGTSDHFRLQIMIQWSFAFLDDDQRWSFWFDPTGFRMNLRVSCKGVGFHLNAMSPMTSQPMLHCERMDNGNIFYQ